MTGHELPSGSTSALDEETRLTFHREFELNILSARDLLKEAWEDPSVMGGYSKWEREAADTFKNIYLLADSLGYEVAQVLRFLSGSGDIFISDHGDVFVKNDNDTQPPVELKE